MMQTQLLARAHEQTWRNGGGSTRELLAWPTPVNWQLRVSVALVRQDGPFSAYPGVQRWFAVLSGDGVLLQRDGQSVMLTPESDPLQFDGATAPECKLLGGATQDLNLMVLQEAGEGRMLQVQPEEEWLSPSAWRAVYTPLAAMLQVDDADAARLAPGTLAWSEHAAHQRWRLRTEGSNATAWWLQFSPRRA